MYPPKISWCPSRACEHDFWKQDLQNVPVNVMELSISSDKDTSHWTASSPHPANQVQLHFTWGWSLLQGDWCPYKKRKCHSKTEACSKARTPGKDTGRDWRALNSKLRRTGTQRVSGEQGPVHTMISHFCSPEPWENTFLLLKPPVCIMAALAERCRRLCSPPCSAHNYYYIYPGKSLQAPEWSSIYDEVYTSIFYF